MRLLLFSSTAFVLVLLTGCSAGTKSMDTREGQALLDSLRTENLRLRDRNRTLRDSIEFYDDIESGQYYRDLRSLKDRLARLTYEVRLLRNGGQTVSVLSTDSLFTTGIDSLHPRGTERLKALARQLQTTYPDRTIRVEGHTDSMPLSDSLKKRFSSNWALSTARATVVVHRLIQLTDLNSNQFVVVGYGASRPRVPNDTPTGRRRNRRIRVAVHPVSHPHTRPFQTSW